MTNKIDALKDEHFNSTTVLKQTLQDAEIHKAQILRMLSEFNNESRRQMGLAELDTASSQKYSVYRQSSMDAQVQSKGRKSVLEEVKSYSTSFEHIMASIKQQITDQQAQIQIKDTQIAKLIENIEGQNLKESQELRIQKELVVQLREENSRLMTDLRDAKERIDDLEADIEEAEVIHNDFYQLKGKLETLNKEMESLHEKYIDAISTSDRYQQQRALLIKDLELSEQKCTDFERELNKRVSQVGRLSIKLFVVLSELERLNGIATDVQTSDPELSNSLTSGVKSSKQKNLNDEELAMEAIKDSKSLNPSIIRKSKIETSSRRRDKLDKLLKGIDAKEDSLKQSNPTEDLSLSAADKWKKDPKSSLNLIPISLGNSGARNN